MKIILQKLKHILISAGQLEALLKVTDTDNALIYIGIKYL